MPLLDSLSSISKYDPLGNGRKVFYGKVISNEDPKLLGRIKIAIPDLLPWESLQSGSQDQKSLFLPWFYPEGHDGLGGGPIGTHFSIPEEDSTVIVTFPYNSIYHGVYRSAPTDKLSRNIDYLSEYPDRYGESDSLENKTIINKNDNVNAVETRKADGMTTIHDSKDSTNTLYDFYGTSIHIDRKNQILNVEFAGYEVTITANSMRIKGNKIILDGTDLVLIGSDSIVLDAPSIVHNGKVVQED